MALNLSINGEGADWVTEQKGVIKKANLTFMAKFLWLIVRHYLSPTAADNIVTWDLAVLMAAMIDNWSPPLCLMDLQMLKVTSSLFNRNIIFPFSI